MTKQKKSPGTNGDSALSVTMAGDLPVFNERIHATSNFPGEISYFTVVIPSKVVDGRKFLYWPVSPPFLSLEAAERALPSFMGQYPECYLLNGNIFCSSEKEAENTLRYFIQNQGANIEGWPECEKFKHLIGQDEQTELALAVA